VEASDGISRSGARTDGRFEQARGDEKDDVDDDLSSCYQAGNTDRPVGVETVDQLRNGRCKQNHLRMRLSCDNRPLSASAPLRPADELTSIRLSRRGTRVQNQSMQNL